MPPPFAGDGCELRATDARLTRVGREQLGDGAAAVVGLPAVPAASSFGFDADYVEPRLTAAVMLQQPSALNSTANPLRLLMRRVTRYAN